MKVFLTGATGFVGRNTLDWLLANVPDVHVDCLVRSWDKAALLPDDARISPVHGDLLKPETYKESVSDAEVVIHTAALVSLRNGPEFYAANVDATDCLLKAAEASSKLSRFVFVGSISAYEREPEALIAGPYSIPISETSMPWPSTDYGKSKLQAQQRVQSSGLPYAIVIPSYIFGPHPRLKSSMDRLIYDVRDAKPYTTLPLPGRATAIYAPDLAEAIWLGATNDYCKNEEYFAGNEQPVKVGDAYEAIARTLKKKDYKMRVASDETLARLKNHVYTKRPNEAFVKVLFEDYFWANTDKLFRLTGWRPQHTLGEGVDKTIGWYRAQGLL